MHHQVKERQQWQHKTGSFWYAMLRFLEMRASLSRRISALGGGKWEVILCGGEKEGRKEGVV